MQLEMLLGWLGVGACCAVPLVVLLGIRSFGKREDTDAENTDSDGWFRRRVRRRRGYSMLSVNAVCLDTAELDGGERTRC